MPRVILCRGGKRLSEKPQYDVYELLAHPVRRALLERLHNRPRSSFTELMKVTGENTGSLSFHLAKLEPLLSQDDSKKYSLNQSGEEAYSIMSQAGGPELGRLQSESSGSSVNLGKGEKIILSTDRARPLGIDHIIGGLTKSNIHRVSVTLTSDRLLLTSFRFFRPPEIPLGAVKLVRVKKDIPITKGDRKGRSIEVTYADSNDHPHWIRFVPPDVGKWASAIRQACADFATLP